MVHSEEEEKAWREKHRENVKKYKQSKNEDVIQEEQLTDEQLWDRLDELEIEEDIEELKAKAENFKKAIVADKCDLKEKRTALSLKNEMERVFEQNQMTEEDFTDPKLQVLRIVVNKQNDLEMKLQELKNKERGISKTEQDFINKLDELEELDEIEDEMER